MDHSAKTRNAEVGSTGSQPASGPEYDMDEGIVYRLLPATVAFVDPW